MVVRFVKFRIDENMNVTPSAAQYGGVQGEHNATEVIFIFADDSKLLADGLTLHIEATTSVGGYDKTNTLTPEVYSGEEGYKSVQFLVPLAWTQYGAETTLRLVAEQDGTVAYTAEGIIRFEERQTNMEKVDSLLRTTIGDAMKKLEEVERLDSAAAAQRANAAADAADKAADDAIEATAEIIENGFVKSVKELNDGNKIHVWVGTEAQYNALGEKAINTLYIVSDDNEADYVVECVDHVCWVYRRWKSGKVEHIPSRVLISENGGYTDILAFADELCESGFDGVFPIQVGSNATGSPNGLDLYCMGNVVCNGKQNDGRRECVVLYTSGSIYTNIRNDKDWNGWLYFKGTPI